MLLATLCDTDQSFAGLLMLGDVQQRTHVCAITPSICDITANEVKSITLNIAESGSEAEICWPVIYQRDVYRSTTYTEYLSTSFESL